MKNNTHIIYGLLTALAMIILGVILYVTDMSFKSGMQYIVYIPFLLGIILNAVAFSKANNADVTFGSVFSSCFKACAIITLISIAWSFIAFMIFPEMVDKSMEIAREAMEKKGLSDDQISKGTEMMHKWFKLFMVMGILFYYMFIGAIFSLIAAAIAKKNPKPTAQV